MFWKRPEHGSGSFKKMNDSMHYQIEGMGKPVLLIHGWAMHSGVWADFVKEFSTRHKIITVDLRGHKKSVSMAGPYDFLSFADDITRLILALGLKRVTLIGWSMGVSILLKMMESSLPCVDSVVLINGNPCLVSREDYKQGLPEITIKRLFRQVERDYPKGLQNFYKLLFTADEAEALKCNGRYSMVADLHAAPTKQAALESLACLQNEDLRPAVKKVRVPALIIHGSEDRICAPAAAYYMHNQINRSHILFLEKTGHVPFITKKDAVHRAIAEFLESL